MTHSRLSVDAVLGLPDVTAASVRTYLESLEPAARVQAVTALGRTSAARLWALATDDAIALADLVAVDATPLEPIAYEGQNNLPVLRQFRKVFYRTTTGMVGGYNDTPARWLAGPGYFSVEQHGRSVAINYVDLPTEKPASLPAIRSNGSGLASKVYGDMVDHLRRVATGVYVGRAYKAGTATENYFVIAR
jgi:hypothetical protein